MTDPEFEIRPSVLVGETADVYLRRTLEVLRHESVNPVVTIEVTPSREGRLCGIKEVEALLRKVLPEGKREVWAMEEGSTMHRKEAVLRITAPYAAFALYETAYLGILAQCSGWATAASECVEVARRHIPGVEEPQPIPVISFGARHVHPNVAALMDYAAIIGGCTSCTTSLGAKLAGVVQPFGTVPHSLVLVLGDTLRTMNAFDRHIPPEIPRTAPVDALRDEAEESVRIAQSMGQKLVAVQLDTPAERGGVTPDLVKEVRARLDLAGFRHVQILVSGGITRQKIEELVEAEAPVDTFGVGGYIAGASPVDMTADLRQIEGRPVAKRGRIPGITTNPRLRRIL